MADEDEIHEEEQSSGLPPLEMLRSYAAYLVRALRRYRLLSVGTFLVCLGLVSVALVVWPRTYHCEMKLLVQRMPVFESQDSDPLRAAAENMMRHENLEVIVKRVDLPRNWVLQRAPVLRLKDRVLDWLRGPVSPAQMTDTLVNTLEARLSVSTQDLSLIIAVDWPDAGMSARIVEAARETFMEARHFAEISLIQEKIDILDTHANRVREEIDGMAEQLQRMKEEQLARAQRVGTQLTPSPETPRGAAPQAAVPRPQAMPVDEEKLRALKEELDAKRRSINDQDGDRSRRLLDAQARLRELKTRLTPEHPLVLDAERQIASLSQEPASVTALRGDVKRLEGEYRSLTEAPKVSTSPGGGGGRQPSSATAQPAAGLPTRVLELLQAGQGVDPITSTQLQLAVEKFSKLRADISSTRIQLDNAQAAFKLRYKVVVPTEVPGSPIKPKVAKLGAVGLLISLLLALLLPLLLELQNGLIVERWQVHSLPVPVLAELQKPRVG